MSHLLDAFSLMKSQKTKALEAAQRRLSKNLERSTPNEQEFLAIRHDVDQFLVHAENTQMELVRRPT